MSVVAISCLKTDHPRKRGSPPSSVTDESSSSLLLSASAGGRGGGAGVGGGGGSGVGGAGRASGSAASGSGGGAALGAAAAAATAVTEGGGGRGKSRKGSVAGGGGGGGVGGGAGVGGSVGGGGDADRSSGGGSSAASHRHQSGYPRHLQQTSTAGINPTTATTTTTTGSSYEKTNNMASSNHRGIQIGSAWFQRKINLRPQHRGIHLVTEEILRQMPELGQFSVGLCHVQILHTSASLALNESWDPDVRDDMEMMLNKIVPEGLQYRHSCEGPDDMPAHVKACFLGSSLTIPITDGKLSLGTWQGVWLCEHRDHAGSRKLVITLSGCPRDSARSPLSPVSPIASTSS